MLFWVEWAFLSAFHPNTSFIPLTSASGDTLLSSLLDPLEGLGVLNCGKMKLRTTLDSQH
jgi:hypothetical protein